MIGEAIRDAAERYVGDDYRARVVAEWARGAFNIQVEGEELAGMRKYEDVEDLLRAKAKNQVADTLRSELAEFVGEGTDDPESWDVKSIKSWAMSRFSVSLTERQIREASVRDLEDELIDAADERIDRVDTTPLATVHGGRLPAEGAVPLGQRQVRAGARQRRAVRRQGAGHHAAGGADRGADGAAGPHGLPPA